jgi:hypothetical protein
VIERLVSGPVETYLAPDVTHILRRQAGPPSLGAYRSEAREPLDAGVTDRVVGWVTATVGCPAGRS